MSSAPRIAAKKPVEVSLTAGQEVWFCTCGQSAKQPFCDGSHKGSEFRPLAHRPEKTGTAWFCQCKHTKKAPFCDGSHGKL
jgi:CDGSH-type Zn-finger protein